MLDAGGGASSLVDALLERGHRDVTVLDLAPAALAVARRRLGGAADRVAWVAADLLAGDPPRRFDVWHDRAVFHFLVDPGDRGRYVAVLRAALAPGGLALVATFAPDGPPRCSGLPVRRYDAEGLLAALGGGFSREATRREEHVTPGGTVQPFTWLAARRRAARARPATDHGEEAVGNDAATPLRMHRHDLTFPVGDAHTRVLRRP